MKDNRRQEGAATRAIDAESISSYLDAHDDFDLELFAQRELTLNGWSSHQGGTYKDGVTGKYRQYDVRAIKNFAMDTYISMAVECKSLSPENPLIISRVPRPDYDCYHHVTECTDYDDLPETVTFLVKKAQNHLSVYAPGEMVGKATSQLRWEKGGDKLISSDNETYEKWSQAIASAADSLTDVRTFSGGGLARTFWMPILLVSNETLWVVDYDKEGRRSAPRREDSATLFVGREYSVAPAITVDFTHLHVYTRIGFKQMLADLRSQKSNIWHKLFGFLFIPEAKFS